MKKYQILLLIALMFITVFVFYPALNSEFVNIDDRVFIEGNSNIKSLTPANIKALLFKTYYRMYHPLVNISFAAEYSLFKDDPYIYHATNLVLHLISTLFVFFIFLRLSKNNFFMALITALIFACHPMHVESVAWISSRKDTLYAFFFLASILVYMKTWNNDKNKTKNYIFSLTLFVCACLSKSMAVTLPALLILFDWFEGRKFNKHSVVKYIPFFAVTLCFILITYSGYYFAEEKVTHTAYSIFNNFISAHFNFLFYMFKFLIPSKLSVLYPYFYDSHSMLPGYIMKSPALVYGIFVIVLASLKYSKKIFFGFAFFIITISPVINVFPTGSAPVADRYTYVPFIGFGFIVSAVIVYIYGKLGKARLKKVFAGLVCTVFIFMCVKANAQVKTWHDTKILFDNVIENYPGQIAIAYATRGVYFGEKGDDEAHEKDLTEALRISPDSGLASYSLAGLRIKQKRYDEALKLYENVTLGDPNLTMTVVNMIKIFREQDRHKDIETVIDNALKRDDINNKTVIYIHAGQYYADTGNYEKALEYFAEVKNRTPKSDIPYLGIANVYRLQGNPKAAVMEYIEGIKNCGETRKLLFSLANLYFNTGFYENAERIFLKLTERNPRDYESYDFLGNISAIREDYKDALVYYTMSVLINNKFGMSYFHRAAVFKALNKYRDVLENVTLAEKSGFNVPSDFKNEISEKTGISL